MVFKVAVRERSRGLETRVEDYRGKNRSKLKGSTQGMNYRLHLHAPGMDAPALRAFLQLSSSPLSIYATYFHFPCHNQARGLLLMRFSSFALFLSRIFHPLSELTLRDEFIPVDRLLHATTFSPSSKLFHLLLEAHIIRSEGAMNAS